MGANKQTDVYPPDELRELRRRLADAESEVRILREREARYHALFETSHEAMITIEDGRLVDCNPAALRLFDCGRDDMVCEFPVSFSHETQPDGRNSEDSSKDMIKLAIEGEAQLFEWRHTRRDGTHFDAEVSLNPVDLSGKRFVQGIIRDVTKQKQLESILAESESRLRTIVEAAKHVSFIMTDVGGGDARIREFSPGAESIFGYRREEIIGRPVALLHLPEDVRRFPEIICEMRKNGTPFREEMTLIKKSGEQFPALFTSYPLFGENDHLIATLGISIDISERRNDEEALKRAHDYLEKRLEEQTSEIVRANEELKREIIVRVRAEKVLKESQDWLRCIFEGSLDGIFIAGADAGFIDVNRAATLLTGYSREEIKTMYVPDLYENTDRHAFNNFFKRIMGGEKITAETKILRKDGKKVDTEFRSQMIMIGSTPYMHTVVRDITGRKQAEKALKDTVVRMNTLIHAIPDVIYFKDPQGRNIVFNQAFQDLTGMKNSDITGKTDKDLFPWEMAEICHKSDGEVISSGKMRRFEESFTVKDGGKIIFDTIKSPIFSGNGEFEGLVGISRDVTEKRRAEEALRESELKYRTLFEDSMDAIYLRNRDGELLDVNQAMLDLFGYTREELIGINVRDLRVEPSDMDKFQKKLETRGSVKAYEERLRKKDGTEMICQVTSTVGANEGRTSPGYQGIIRDVTERKFADAALRQSEEKFRLLFEKSIDAILLLDSGRIIDCNQAALDMMGSADKTRLLGLHTCDLSPERQPDGQASSQAAGEMRSTAFREGSSQFEWIFRKMDGREFPAEVLLTSIPIGNKRILYSVLRDITFRKRAEEELRRSEQRLAEVINFLPDATWAVDREGLVTVWNRGAEKMTGIPAADILGKGNHEYALPFYGFRRPLLIDLVRFPDHEIENKYDSIEREGQTLIGEAMAPFPEKGSRYLWGKASAIYNPDGEITGAIESVRDITAHKKAEEEKKGLEAHLLQAQRMEAMGVLAGGIAHDFNNILTALLGYAELAQYHVSEKGELHYSIDQIIKAGYRARDLVKQILAFSRQTEHNKQPSKIGPIIKEALKLLRASLPRTINIRSEVTPEKGAVLADQTRIHQVLMNLCTNAHHAMMEKGGTLGVTLDDIVLNEDQTRAHHDLKPGPYVRLTVSDTGRGMDSDTMARIFDPYFTTKAKGVGTGLGLSVVHGIVKDHGGTVLVQSARGKGSSFTVLLPSIKTREKAALKRSDPIPCGSERILFLDDEETLADLGKRLISHLGYQVTAMTTSTLALEAFRAEPYRYDLLITDMTMPGITGEVLTREVMKIRPDIPVILCTGFSEQIDEERALGMGAKAFVMKPMVLKELGRIIRRVLDEPHSTKEKERDTRNGRHSDN